MTFGAGYTMAAVTTGIQDFLANPIVLGVVVLGLALKIGPRAVSALKRVGGRG